MSVTAKVLVGSKFAEGIQTTQYTAPALTTTIIDKFTATNVFTVAETLSINIITNGGVAGSSNLITKTKTLQAGEVYTFPEIVGQILNPGDFISVIANVVNTIVIRVSGREIV